MNYTSKFRTLFCIFFLAGSSSTWVEAQRWQLIFEDTLYHYALTPQATLDGLDRSLWWTAAYMLPSNHIQYTFGKTWWFDSLNQGQTAFYRMGPGPLGQSCVADTATGDYLFHAPPLSPFLVKANAQLGETWVADTALNLTCLVEQEWEEVTQLGTDSLRLIRLSSGDSLVLGKRFGVHIFPLRDSLHQHFHLAGAKGDTIYGVRVPNVHSVYGWLPGDKYYYHELFVDGHSPMVSEQFHAIEIDSITSTQYGGLNYWQDGNVRLNFHPSLFRWMERVRSTQIISPKPFGLGDFGNYYTYGLIDWGHTFGIASPVVGICSQSINPLLPNEFQAAFGGTTIESDTFLYPTYLGQPQQFDTLIQYAQPTYAQSFLYADSLGLVFGSDEFEWWWEFVLVGYERNGVLVGANSINPYIGQAETQDISAVLYPNPATDWLSVMVPSAQAGLQCEIWNLQGQLVYSEWLQTTQTTLNLSDFPPGIFSLRLIGPKGSEGLYRFVVLP